MAMLGCVLVNYRMYKLTIIYSFMDLSSCLRQLICSKVDPTYVPLRITLSNHSAAALLTISPFFLKDFPGQVFFSASYTFKFCCANARSPDAKKLIVGQVQSVYDCKYCPCIWDFSFNYWYVSIKHAEM